jgi:outer membrane protein assembly factor BamB
MRRFGPLCVLLLAALVAVPAVGAEPPLLPPPPPGKVRVRPPIGGPVGPAGTSTVAADVSDADALKQAGLSATEAAPLVEYLKMRTLTDRDQNKIGDVIKRFGADDFEERVKATEEVERFGPAAIGPLKTAERDADPEIAYRAKQALKRMEKVPHSQVAAAAVRALVKLKPKEAAAVLIGFLPMADTDDVAEEIRSALIALAVTDGKPEPALVAALDDKSVLRRAAAYVALVEGGDPAERVRIKEAFPLVKSAVRKEPDVDAKFRGLWALLMTSREKEFVPDLIDLIPQLPRGRIWQLEEFLLLLAGDTKPDAKFGKSAEQLTKAKDAWAGWWAKKGGTLDLVKFDFKPRVTGYTDVIEYDYRGYGVYRVVTLGPDLKEKVKIGGTGVAQINYPSDVKKLPNGNYLIAEQNGNRLTERDSTGKIGKQTSVTQPLSIDLLPEGGAVVVCRNQVVQFNKDMEQVWAFQRQQYDIMGGRRLPGGDVVFVTNTVQGQNCFRVSAAQVEKDGKKVWEVKEVGKPLTLGRIMQFQSIDATGPDRIMVCEGNRVIEYDLKTGKDVWKHDVNSPTSCQRLPNGNTLITLINQPPNGKVLEIDTTGETVWEYESKDGLRSARAYRR